MGRKQSLAVENLHMGALALTALALGWGLVSRQTDWVKIGVSLTLLLPPLRIATSVVDEVQSKRFGVAVMGVLVLAVLLFSRRIS